MRPLGAGWSRARRGGRRVLQFAHAAGRDEAGRVAADDAVVGHVAGDHRAGHAVGVARLLVARDQGGLSPDFDLDLAMAILSGPLYFRLLITQEPLTHAYVDRILDALFAGMAPRP